MPPFVETDDQRQRRRLARAVRIPTVSGKMSVLWLIVCFIVTAGLVPVVFRLPPWIECEIVLGLWWAVWFAVLTRLLYVGWHVLDDHTWTGPRLWFAGSRSTTEEGTGGAVKETSSGSIFGGILDVASAGSEFEGCLVVIAIFVAFAVLFFGAWLLIEIAIPALAFVLYFAVQGMLARSVNNGGACRGRLAQCLGTALLWATVYTAPIAGAVWLIHRLIAVKPNV